MGLLIVYEHKSPHFKYSVRESMYKGKQLYFISVLISYGSVFYQLAEKNSIYGATSIRLAKKRIMNKLREKCVGTSAESLMKSLPIFIEEGYQESLFPEE